MNKISIHKTKESDIDAIVLLENTRENSQYIFPNSKEEHEALIDDKDIAHLTLMSENDQMVGFIILAGLTNKSRNIEFRRIVIKQKGKGYGRTAIKKIKDYCFLKLHCHRLWLDVLDTNERAKKLYQSEGFKEEGILRDCLKVDGQYKSLVIMSILEDEYKNSTANNV